MTLLPKDNVAKALLAMAVLIVVLLVLDRALPVKKTQCDFPDPPPAKQECK